MEELILPKFTVPDDRIEPKMTPDQYVEWVETNQRLLRLDGKLDAICESSNRGPVAVRFRLNASA